jgi:hypothetical protein
MNNVDRLTDIAKVVHDNMATMQKRNYYDVDLTNQIMVVIRKHFNGATNDAFREVLDASQAIAETNVSNGAVILNNWAKARISRNDCCGGGGGFCG